jgi:hypothetical protein
MNPAQPQLSGDLARATGVPATLRNPKPPANRRHSGLSHPAIPYRQDPRRGGVAPANPRATLRGRLTSAQFTGTAS